MSKVKELTRQEVFTKVWNHLLVQGKRARDYYKCCVYRSAEGLMCAAGCLILDEFYKEDFEGSSVGELPEIEEALTNSGVRGEDLSMVEELQKAHDGVDPPYWIGSLTRVADEYDVIVPPKPEGSRL